MMKDADFRSHRLYTVLRQQHLIKVIVYFLRTKTGLAT